MEVAGAVVFMVHRPGSDVVHGPYCQQPLKRSRSSNHARLTRHYKINASGSHFCEISHAGRLIRVSEAKGNVLFEFNPDNVLHGEKQDSRVLGKSQ